jgi:hypothetical protein
MKKPTTTLELAAPAAKFEVLVSFSCYALMCMSSLITSFERGEGAKLIVAEADAERNDQCSQELKQQQAAGEHGQLERDTKRQRLQRLT